MTGCNSELFEFSIGAAQLTLNMSGSATDLCDQSGHVPVLSVLSLLSMGPGYNQETELLLLPLLAL